MSSCERGSSLFSDSQISFWIVGVWLSKVSNGMSVSGSHASLHTTSLGCFPDVWPEARVMLINIKVAVKKYFIA
jgi:hypothetical protein